MADITCSGPGPHAPASGVLGQATRASTALCSSPACAPTPGITATEANGTTIRQQATSALTANRTFVALAAPTNAQVVAQVKALTRQMNGVVRLQLGALDGTD